MVLKYEIRRFKSTKSDIEKGRQLLKQFVLPIPGEDLNELSIDQYLPNEPLKNIYKNWHLHPRNYLPTRSPINPTPYQFHSTYNEEKSYVRNPRLSVTKLLTHGWCELRDYYQVYGESVKKRSVAMTKGSKLHDNLEIKTHKVIDTAELSLTLDEKIEKKIKETQALLELIEDPGERQLETERLEQFKTNAYGHAAESKLAMEWAQSIMSRLFTLFTTSEAREVLVHGYINLTTGEFVTEIDAVPQTSEENTLISGIVDHFQLEDLSDRQNLDLIENINLHLQYASKHYINDHHIIDLSIFFREIPEIIKDTSFRVITTDVKTRSWNKIPEQKSVVESAKYQTFYYRKLLGLLSDENQQENFAYYSLLENARQRGVDVDKPINYSTIVKMLRKFPEILFQDFIKLANGTEIGFKPFDDYKTQDHYYNLKDYFDDEESDLMVDLKDDYDYSSLFTDDLLKQWVTPPTLRYFAARGNQFYHLTSGLLSDITTVEYHNTRSKECFHTDIYHYDEEELTNQLSGASTFWTGKRAPDATTDLGKCNHCNFSSKCKVPNHQSDEDFDAQKLGPTIYQFLNNKQ